MKKLLIAAIIFGSAAIVVPSVEAKTTAASIGETADLCSAAVDLVVLGLTRESCVAVSERTAKHIV